MKIEGIQVKSIIGGHFFKFFLNMYWKKNQKKIKKNNVFCGWYLKSLSVSVSSELTGLWNIMVVSPFSSQPAAAEKIKRIKILNALGEPLESPQKALRRLSGGP